MILRSRL